MRVLKGGEKNNTKQHLRAFKTCASPYIILTPPSWTPFASTEMLSFNSLKLTRTLLAIKDLINLVNVLLM